MDRYGGTQSALNIALLGGLYIAIITDGYGGPILRLQYTLLGGFYILMIMDR
jgi:hypothetical protein